MKILFLESHPMWIYGLPNGFRDAGHQVLVSGPLTKENLPNMIKEFSPDLIFSMGWGPENSSLEKQQIIKDYVKSSKIPHIYWATEDPTHTNAFTIPFLKTVQPDFVFTICRNNVDYYQSLGINAQHLDFGFHSSIHKYTKPCDNYKGKIAVVANAYPNKLEIYPNHYRHKSLDTLIKPLLYKNIKIDFYGKRWDEMKPFLGIDIPKDWLHGYIPYIEANKVYSSNDIIIGIQNHQTQLNQRIYEILGSGGFLVTNNTPEINRLFNVGKDLIVSSSPEETLELIQYYLKYPEKRNEIKAKGIAAVQPHSYKHRAEYIIDVLNEQDILEGKKSLYKLELMECKSFIHEYWELYTVCNGDTLYAISRKFDVSVKQLMELNGLSSDMIEAGQLFKIRRVTSTKRKKSSVLISKGNTKKPYIALTYDAGDGASSTPNLLDILEKCDVKATFFLTGEWIKKYPDNRKTDC